MKIKAINQLKIKLNDSDSVKFKSVLQKISLDPLPIGFTKTAFTDEEQNLINRLSKKINIKK